MARSPDRCGRTASESYERAIETPARPEQIKLAKISCEIFRPIPHSQARAWSCRRSGGLGIPRMTRLALIWAVCALVSTGSAVRAEPTSPSKCAINQHTSGSVADVQTLVNEALGLAQATDDLNGDKVVNVVDIEIEAVWTLDFCSLDPHTYTVGSVPVSIENTISPVVPGAVTVVLGSVPVSIENTFSPVVPGAVTVVAGSVPVSIENTFSPVVPGSVTVVAASVPISIENTFSPVPSSPQTYYSASLVFSMFNGPTPRSIPSNLLSPSLRFIKPVDPAFLAEALARGAQRVDGKPVCLDTDGDGICDDDELIIGTSPYLADSDGDGYPDGLELALGSDPLDPKSIPESRPPGYFATPPVSIQNSIPVAILPLGRQGAIYAANNQ